MTDYGQSIPNKVVHLQDQINLTKAGFTHLFGKALAKVGMVFIPSISSYDLLADSNAEFGIPNQSQTANTFWFDFPTSEVFYVGTTPYRPCVGLLAHSADVFGQLSSNSQWVNGWSLRLGRRRADRIDLNDFRTLYYQFVDSGYYGLGSPTGSVNAFEFGLTMRQKEGGATESTPPFWKPFAASAMSSSQTYLKNIKNFYVYLGKAGLFCFMGGGMSSSDFGNILSAGIAFGGARIPGRARIPNQDPNLNRMNPAVEIPMFASGSWWDGTKAYSYTMGMQFDLKQTLLPVVTEVYNLENVEQPIKPSYTPPTLRSPRIVNGSGAYILSRPIYSPQYVYNDTSNLMGPVDPLITGSDVRPQWEDLFTCSSFRFGDRTVSAPGEYTDPVSSKLWFLVHAENIGMAYALAYDGRTIYTDVNLTRTLIGTVNVDFSVGGFAGPFPSGVTVTQVIQNGVTWTATPGQDEVTLNPVSQQSYSDNEIIIDYTPDPSDPVDTAYEIQFDSKFSANSYGPTPPFLSHSTYDNFNTLIQFLIYNGSLNPSDPQFHYQTVTRSVTINATTGKIRFIIDFHDNGYTLDLLVAMRNFKILKYRST